VEEHFYLIWPAAVRSLSRRNLAVCAAGIAVLMPVFRGVAFSLGLADGLSSYTWLVADGLAMGALLALLLRRPGVTRKTIGRCAALGFGLAAALLAFGAPFGILTRRRLLGAALQVTPWNLAFAALLASMLLVGTSPWKCWVRRPLLSFFGDISYGLYLVHMLAFWQYDKLLRNYWPALGSIQSFGLLTIRFVVAGGAAVAIAFLSRWWFEERFLRLKNARIPVAQNRSLTVAAL
jgi:peptidoglycan/LPS O-acetylase OafA/YrhL